MLFTTRHRVLSAVMSLSACVVFSGVRAQSAHPTEKTPVQYANGLVGTAPLDNQKLVGNAPPPGEQLYSGFTSPGAELPHSSTDIAPINANLTFEYPAGVPASYYYPNPTMFGFSSGGIGGPIVMPVVGNWTVPPQRSASVYDRAREKSSPGYYAVYLDNFQTEAEMTATTWTGLYRFTFPATEKAHLLLDLGEAGGEVDVVGDHTVRGQAQHLRAGQWGGASEDYFVAEFSRPFRSFGRVPAGSTKKWGRRTGPGRQGCRTGRAHDNWAFRRCLPAVCYHAGRAGDGENRARCKLRRS